MQIFYYLHCLSVLLWLKCNNYNIIEVFKVREMLHINLDRSAAFKTNKTLK